MHALTFRAAATIIGLAVVTPLAAPLAAQGATRPTFGITGGLALPTGDFGDGAKSGFEVGAQIGFSSAALPFGLRIDGAYDQFESKATSSAKSKILSFTGNAVFGGTAAPGSVRPYALAGLGVYNLKGEVRIGNVTSSSAETKFGLNGGAGIDLPLSGIAAFIEARFHFVMSSDDDSNRGNTTYIPVVVGIRF